MRNWRSVAPTTGVIVSVLMLAMTPSEHVTAAGASKPYRILANWPELPPGEAIGAVSWVAVDAKGAVYAFRRCPKLPACVDAHPRPNDPLGNIWKFSSEGRYLATIADGVAKEAHGLQIDRNGFMWTTDVQRHTVKKLRLDGTVLMTLGKDGVPGETPDTFNQPTNVWVAPSGDFFVTDGYGNQRVVKFNKEGKYVKAWGTKGTGEGQFRLPHAIVQDSRGRLIVADRCGLSATRCTDGRIQIFDTDGKFLGQLKQIQGLNFQPFALAITKDDHLYVADTVNSKIWILDASRGGEVLDKVDDVAGMHGMTVDAGGDIYLANVGGGIHRYSRGRN
jgi:sugar lactone lactonase YvrE